MCKNIIKHKKIEKNKKNKKPIQEWYLDVGDRLKIIIIELKPFHLDL